MKKFNSVRGKIGEDIAVAYLKKNGYKIIETNYRNKMGEIDIIACDKRFLVFLEVKSRSNNMFGLPREAADGRKQRKIRNSAMIFINQKRLFDKSARFDVIELIDDQITHIKDCF